MDTKLLILGIVVIAIACIAGCATTPPYTTPTPTPTATTTVTTAPPTTPQGTGAITIKTASTAGLGTYLANANGLALYYFARDVPGSGSTACNTSTCLSLWTLFSPNNILVSSDLQASDFGTIAVSGGQQVTYRGWPLYLYNGDTAQGLPGGDGFGGVWYVMKPDYSVMIMENSQAGLYLADGLGNTLYNFSIDSRERSVCMNDSSVLIQGQTCIQLWPPYYTASPVVPSALNTADFSLSPREDGMMQTAFRGWPLYYFRVDTGPGQTSGQGINGFGGTWFVVSPTAVAVTPTTTSPATTTTIPSGGYGY
jgi:predicted lipoprotein with Yx(FWY)xxD motif